MTCDLNEKDENFLIESIKKFKVEIVGIGNRTGFGHMEKIVAQLIEKIRPFHGKKLAFTSVSRVFTINGLIGGFNFIK